MGATIQIWFDIANTFSDITDKLGKIFDAAADFLKNKLGIDIKGAFTVVTETVGNVADSLSVGVKEAAKNVGALFQGKYKTSLSDSITAQRAIETGAQYNQGNIKGLNEQGTKALHWLP